MTTRIETTFGALLDAEAALGRLLDVPLPGKARYHVLKLVRLVVPELQRFGAERVALIKAIGIERDPTAEELAAGTTDRVFQVTPEQMPVFEQRLAELRAAAVTLPWGGIPLSALDTVAVTGRDILALGPLVVYDEE